MCTSRLFATLQLPGWWALGQCRGTSLPGLQQQTGRITWKICSGKMSACRRRGAICWVSACHLLSCRCAA